VEGVAKLWARVVRTGFGPENPADAPVAPARQRSQEAGLPVLGTECGSPLPCPRPCTCIQRVADGKGARVAKADDVACEALLHRRPVLRKHALRPGERDSPASSGDLDFHAALEPGGKGRARRRAGARQLGSALGMRGGGAAARSGAAGARLAARPQAMRRGGLAGPCRRAQGRPQLEPRSRLHHVRPLRPLCPFPPPGATHFPLTTRTNATLSRWRGSMFDCSLNTSLAGKHKQGRGRRETRCEGTAGGGQAGGRLQACVLRAAAPSARTP
jgi:hypothetical protein